MTMTLPTAETGTTLSPMKMSATEIKTLNEATGRVREFTDTWRRAVSNMSAVSFVHIDGIKLTVQDLEDALTLLDNKGSGAVTIERKPPGVETDHLVNAPDDNTKVKLLYAYYNNDYEPGLTDSMAAYWADVLNKGYTSRCSELRQGGLIEIVGKSKMDRKQLCRITERGKDVIRKRNQRSASAGTKNTSNESENADGRDNQD